METEKFVQCLHYFSPEVTSYKNAFYSFKLELQVPLTPLTQTLVSVGLLLCIQ